MKANKAVFLVVIIALSLGAMSVLDPRQRVDALSEASVLPPVYAPPVEEVESLELENGQTLSAVLNRASIFGSDLAGLLRAINGVQNLRSLAAGSEVTVRRWKSSRDARSVELRVNRDTAIRVARSDTGWTTSLVVTPVVLDTVSGAGQIGAGQSLYDAIVYSELPIPDRFQLVSDLAAIYDNQLDFSHDIQPNDRYTLVYEREARPDGSARRLRILGARIDNRDTSYYAVYFERGSLAGYYDLQGKSMRTGFRKSPVDYVRVTSNFAWRRYHPILGMYRAHLGTDYGAASGTPVKATGDGVVTSAGRDGGYGNMVVIRHANGYSSRYAHLSRFGARVRAGKRVLMNDVIGYVGATGLATAPHLHYELRLNGRPINSRNVNLPGSPPLPPAYRDEYFGLVKSRLALIQEALLGARFAKKATDTIPSVGGGS